MARFTKHLVCSIINEANERCARSKTTRTAKNMKTVLSPQATKYLERLNEPIKGRIKAALRKLEHEPPQGDIKTLSGQEGFRLRVGNYAPRGRVYRGR
jgi:hypothetical protein